MPNNAEGQQIVLNMSGRLNPMSLRYTAEEYAKVAAFGLKPVEVRHPNKAVYEKSVQEAGISWADKK